ncbi:hypothetical protein CRE_14153 [Caenorhabditis remanei]|uniref:C6 domain-containing protein n=1 Tax=Caenorhabditis remanei TaxID=31234 RepID=E3MRJ4_CAERE|nr:hypothetical protein CRE_14153 [Caenorhabditis remanei]
MRILLVLFPFLARFSDTCAPTRATTPIVCACSTSEVALLYRIDGSDGGAEAIQPVGEVTTSDANNCPTEYTITCTLPEGSTGTVMMMFQDSVSGGLQQNTIPLACTDGNWLYLDETNGQT